VAVIASLISAEASKAKLDAQLEEDARRSLSRVE
jgi:tellurite resistance protein TerC